MEGQRLRPAARGIDFAHGLARDLGRAPEPITEAGSKRFRSLHAFGGAHPQPWVIDANELYNAILYTARKDKANLLARAASSGTITWYVAEHAASEVDKYLDQWAIDAGIDPLAARSAWEKTYRPLLRLISGDLSDLPFTANEEQRLAALAVRDRDDLPTARLAMALGARLVTRDNDLLEATYGPGRTSSDHAAQLVPTASALTASDQLRQVETIALVLPAAMAAAVARLVVQLPVLGVIGAGAAALALRTPERRLKVQGAARGVWTELETALEVWLVAHDTINEQLARYEPVLGSLPTTIHELDADARSRIAMWLLARSRGADASPEELTSRWPASAHHLRSMTAIRSVLQTASVFTDTTEDRFQLGTSLQPRD